PEEALKPKAQPSIVDPEYLVNRADEAYEKGDYAEALKLLRNAHAKDRKNSDILNKLGFILSKEGENDEAISSYLESLELKNDDDMVHNAIASVYRNINETAKAREHYERALMIDDEYAITYFNFANLLVDIQEIDEAKVMYDKAILIDPDFTQAKFEREKLK
ncbi:MAG: tetratricopeptide repeat protein, partial [Campylobacterota bacterium]|nr:tetratricopeptide repeat protein [Campylobacterota bacterium]